MSTHRPRDRASAEHPSRPPLSSVPRFLLWQASRQPKTLLAGVGFGVLWMLCQAVWPYLLGHAIDDGIANSSPHLWVWAALLLGVALVQAGTGVMRHRMAVSNWLGASLDVSRLIGHHAAETGPAMTATTASGEIVATVTSDALTLGAMFDVVARLAGGIVAYLVVAIIMLLSSWQLGVAVLVGVPLVGVGLALLIRPLQKQQGVWREASGRLTTLGADTVVGLRILRGIGGETEFVERYAKQSQAVREAGVGVARTQSWLDGLQVALPGIFLVFVVWYGARLAFTGEISPGELATFYGYATFLVLPLRTGVEATQTGIRGTVAVRRILHVLRITPAWRDSATTDEAPPRGSDLVDVVSGLRVESGLFTAIVDPDPDAAAAVATRLGRFDDDVHREAPVFWGGLDHTTVPVASLRSRIVVSDADPHLFGGRLLDGLDITPSRRPEFVDTTTGRIRRVTAALETAAATETVEALPDGVHEHVAERGRSFSGGQRQRLSLARALLTDAEILVLIEPTSAVDAHTEAQIARRLRRARDGETTVIVTSSPLLLNHADRIAVMRDGRVVGTGTHTELLRLTDELGDLYRSVVSRAMNTAEPHDATHLDDAWTGTIDVLWNETHPGDDARTSDEEGESDASAPR